MNDSLPKYVGPKPTDRLLTKDEIRKRFDNETANAYSQEDPVYLPDYASTFELLIDCILQNSHSAMTILDIGAGTGNMSLRLLRRETTSHVTLVDFSQNMLNAVSDVLKGFENRFNVVCDDFFNLTFPAASFDAIVSSFAIHHARSMDEYVGLYRKIHGWLKPGGIFACADVVNGSTADWTKLNENGWAHYLSAFFNAEKINQIFANYHSEDSPVSLPEHIAGLHLAGFAQTDILWKRYNFALYCGKKKK
jgi:tRNA (cmo5U34)-methyltransferase